MDSHPPLVRTRLSVMMFLEFFVYGCWGVAIAGYGQKLGFSGSQIGWLIAVAAIGAIISPLFVGLIADRYFAAQRMLSVLHVLGAACLIGAGFQNKFLPLVTLMLLNGLAFMPTMALVNSVAFRHIPDADKFPRIAVLGTLGWIAANLGAEVFLGGAAKPNFLFLGGAGSLVLALYAWTLPDTPPKGAEAGADVFGLSALKLLKESTFLIFIVCVFLFSIPACGYFFTLMVPMFQQRGYAAPLALGTLNQFAEIVFMFSMPWFVSKLGLKRVLLIGMAAWAVRYLCFASPAFSFPLALLGLVLHGFCYSFFYVGSYMWIDRRAPAELKSSAQSLLTFLLLGVGFLLGAKGAGFMMGQFPPRISHTPTYTIVEVAEAEKAGNGIPNRVLVKWAKDSQRLKVTDRLDDGVAEVKQVKNPLPRWDDPKEKKTFWRFLNLSATVAGMLQSAEEKAKATEDNQRALLERLDADNDGKVSRSEIEAVGEDGVVIEAADDGSQQLTYSKQELTEKFNAIQSNVYFADADFVERSHWLASALGWDLLTQLDTNKDEKISLAELEVIGDSGVQVGGAAYAEDDLIGTFKQVHKVLDLEGEVVLDRPQWLKAQACNWAPIWLWPSGAAFIILAFFALAFRDKPPEEEGPAESPESPEKPGTDEG